MKEEQVELTKHVQVEYKISIAILKLASPFKFRTESQVLKPIRYSLVDASICSQSPRALHGFSLIAKSAGRLASAAL